MGFDPEHYRIVKEAVEKGQKIDLPGAKLEGADLSDVSFKNANLRGSDLRGVDLRGVDLTAANLRNANLRNANLKNADLRNSNLRNADLRSADLTSSNLNGANLRNAILNSANLSSADFRYAALEGANLIGANLKNADLNSANLNSVDFRNAVLAGVDFSNAAFGITAIDSSDLSEAKGLESIKHTHQSTVGFESLVLSKGKIPRVFLQGCGLPDSYIDYIPSHIGALNPIDFYSCFISYSHQDKSFANRLHNDLQSKGIRCWLDDHEIKMGDDIYSKVDQGIRLWDKVILCASEHSLASGWVGREVDTAIEMELKHRKEAGRSVLKIIPLNLDNALFNWNGAHASALRKRLAGDFTDWDKDNAKYDKTFDRLVEALKAAAESEPPPQKLFES